MILPIVLRRRATNDLQAGYRWYEAERDGLGSEFLNAFKRIALSIQEFPQTFARLNAKIRRANIERFPYTVFYQIEANRIVVLAVIHSARHPKSWPPAPKRTR